MKHVIVRASIILGAVGFSLVSFAAELTPTDNMALNDPDQMSWRLFLEVNARSGGSQALFSTWASDHDTFQMTPVFPDATTPLAHHDPVLGPAIQTADGPPAPTEEVRRNRVAFDYIVENNLFTVSGLVAAFGRVLTFPTGAIEVKTNWLPIEDVPEFTLNRVTAAEVQNLFYVVPDSDGNLHALIAMHLISKIVPNWTWATFEHELNPGRCDVIGCADTFGAVEARVIPNEEPNQGYQDCRISDALSDLFATADVDPLFQNYCLKGSQTEFTDNTGLPVRLGNSVTEAGFLDRSSCMTCHGLASFNEQGLPTTGAGFIAGQAQLGPIQPSWYWSFVPHYANPEDLTPRLISATRVATSADFVWSIPFCAVDDTDPDNIPPTRCASK